MRVIVLGFVIAFAGCVDPPARVATATDAACTRLARAQLVCAEGLPPTPALAARELAARTARWAALDEPELEARCELLARQLSALSTCNVSE